MNSSNSFYTSDWFAVSLRWLVLLGLSVSLALGGALLSWPNVLLIVLAIWNSVLTVSAGLNRRMGIRRQISLGFDILIVSLYFVWSGGYTNHAFLIILLPILTGALYFEVRGVLVAGFMLMAVQLAYTLLRAPEPLDLLRLGGAVAVTIVLSAILVC